MDFLLNILLIIFGISFLGLIISMVVGFINIKKNNNKHSGRKIAFIFLPLFLISFTVASYIPNDTSESDQHSKTAHKNASTITDFIKITTKKNDTGSYSTDKNGNFSINGIALKGINLTVKSEQKNSSLSNFTKHLSIGEHFSLKGNTNNSNDVDMLLMTADDGNHQAKKEIDIANEFVINDESEDASLDSSNGNLQKLSNKIKKALKDGYSGLNHTKVTVQGQTSTKPYTAGIEIYDKDFMDMSIERNSMMDVLNGIQSFDGYDQYENFNVTYYADLQNDKGKVVKHTKVLSFGIKGSQLKQLDPSNMSNKDVKANVNDYWEQKISK